MLSTKVGTVLRNGSTVKDFTPKGMEESFNQSLHRLGVDRVDILYLHGAYPQTLCEETYRFFEREKSRGRITYSGMNEFGRPLVEAFVASPLDVVMLQYNVADLSVADLFDELVARGKVIMAGTILAQGSLSPRTFLPTSWGSMSFRVERDSLI